MPSWQQWRDPTRILTIPRAWLLVLLPAAITLLTVLTAIFAGSSSPLDSSTSKIVATVLSAVAAVMAFLTTIIKGNAQDAVTAAELATAAVEPPVATRLTPLPPAGAAAGDPAARAAAHDEHYLKQVQEQLDAVHIRTLQLLGIQASYGYSGKPGLF